MQKCIPLAAADLPGDLQYQGVAARVVGKHRYSGRMLYNWTRYGLAVARRRDARALAELRNP
jgi:hypothetical protein